MLGQASPGPRHRRLLAFGPVIAALVVAAALVPASAQPAHLRFTRPVTVIGASHVGRANTGEPRLMVLPSGRILLAAHFEQWDCQTGRPTTDTYAMCVWASDDDGRSWHISGGDPQPGDDADFALAPDGSVLELGMTDLSVGSTTLGTGVGGTTVMRSADRGRTWSESIDANSQVINDRPFFLTTPTSVLITFTSTFGNVQAIRSTDGGRSWSRSVQVSPPVRTDTIEVNGGPTYDGTRRQLLVPYVFATDRTCASAPSGCFNVLSLATSSDDGRTWSSELIGRLPTGMGLTSMPQLTVDATGHRFLVFAGRASGHDHVYVLDSGRPGRWSPPRLVDSPQSSGMVAWSAATGRGRLDVAYYRSPGADAATVSRRWDVVLGHSSDGGRHWTTSLIHAGAYTGTGDAHQLVVWDLLGLARDRSGHLFVAWTDDQGKPGGPTVVKVARSM